MSSACWRWRCCNKTFSKEPWGLSNPTIFSKKWGWFPTLLDSIFWNFKWLNQTRMSQSQVSSWLNRRWFEYMIKNLKIVILHMNQIFMPSCCKSWIRGWDDTELVSKLLKINIIKCSNFAKVGLENLIIWYWMMQYLVVLMLLLQLILLEQWQLILKHKCQF